MIKSKFLCEGRVKAKLTGLTSNSSKTPGGRVPFICSRESVPDHQMQRLRSKGYGNIKMRPEGAASISSLRWQEILLRNHVRLAAFIEWPIVGAPPMCPEQ